MDCDVLIYNGRIVDGRSNPWYKGSIAVKDRRIIRIGRKIEAKARERLDAKGMLICPGFIDPHSHSDFVYFIDSTAQSKVRQGVTTEVTGNCGISAAPWNRETSSISVSITHGFSPAWTTVEDYFQALGDIGKPVNIAPLIGHGTLRTTIVGLNNRSSTADELEEMERILADALEIGAFGLSTGLYFAPGNYASKKELIALGKVVASHGAVFASHIRDEGTYTVGFLAAINEVLTIGEESQAHIQISHIKAHGPEVWGQSKTVLALIEEARRKGVEITCDQYPYEASGGSIIADTLPLSFQAGKSAEDIAQKLKEQDVRGKLHGVVGSNIERRGGASRLVVSNYPADPGMCGKTIQEIAEEHSTDPASVVLDMLAKGGIAGWTCYSMDEEDVENFMRYPGTMVSSDGVALSTEGPLSEGHPHPRNFGAFPRIFRLYVRAKKVLRLEDAIRKMTSLPAQTFGIQHRGVLEEGNWADIVIFNEAEVTDATYDDPKQYAQGIPYVMVNGEWVIKDGDFTGRLPGQVLRYEIQRG